VIFVVKLVSKFMKHNILPVGGIRCTMFDGTPREDQRTHSTGSLAKSIHSPFLPNMFTNLVVFLNHV
jgi:hypothetical protein